MRRCDADGCVLAKKTPKPGNFDALSRFSTSEGSGRGSPEPGTRTRAMISNELCGYPDDWVWLPQLPSVRAWGKAPKKCVKKRKC
eukprot:1357117-Amorphochlora_amoeboformis.AAC.1